jgi:hypothetical protein
MNAAGLRWYPSPELAEKLFCVSRPTGIADPRGMKPSFGFVSGHDFGRAIEAQQRSGL